MCEYCFLSELRKERETERGGENGGCFYVFVQTPEEQETEKGKKQEEKCASSLQIFFFFALVISHLTD